MLIINQATFKLPRLPATTVYIEQLSIQPRQQLAIIGHNGSGKTTLANIIAGQLTLLSGEYHNHFQPIKHLSFEQLQRRLEQEWQTYNTDLLLADEQETGLTVQEVILEQLEQPDEQLYQRLITLFGLQTLLNRRFKYL